MRRVVSASVLLLALSPRPVQAAYLSCQAELRNPDCTERTGSLSSGEQLQIGATCQECTGGGSDVKCSPDEKVTAAGLAIETLASAAVAGSFSQVGTCDFGVPRFKHSAGLSPGSYRVVVTVAGFAKTELLTFTVGGTALPGDGGGKPAPTEAGSPPVGDGGKVPVGDGGGGSPREGGTASSDGSGNPGSGSDDGGCSCELAAAASPGARLALLAVGALCCLAWYRRRRS